jgi:ribosome-binding ATPase
MKAACVSTYMDFVTSTIEQMSTPSSSSTTSSPLGATSAVSRELKQQQLQQQQQPDEETAELQLDEVEALTAIFPDEFILLSADHPITFRINLEASEVGIWPPHPIALEFRYPYNYPQCAFLPEIRLEHDNNVMEFSSAQSDAAMAAMLEAARAEEGMPCVMTIVYAAREFFESGAMANTTTLTTAAAAGGGESIDSNDSLNDENENDDEDDDETSDSMPNALLRSASPERIQECNLQGLQIAESILKEFAAATSNRTSNGGKGGQWTYTIGLVGKPSAGKSTFFNAATAFARQRDDKESALGGATMAPHPFTTIDPNIGFCLVPAPTGSCPEDDYSGGACVAKQLNVGCTHGRDNKGRRLIPVLLKDVAGLVPGAYQGRGRGNKFLNDLTDADALIHVLDASGTADVEGNDLGMEQDGQPSSAASHPLNDMSWIRSELIEWVLSNLLHKWVTVKRKGREKLSGMLSGYGQTQWVTWKILDAVEKYLEREEQRGHTLDQLDEWDEGDVHRLVSAFLGVRFPMALAMNKCDLPTSKVHVRDIQDALPIHGAFAAVPLSARSEMSFLRRHLEAALGISSTTSKPDEDEQVLEGVWQCLQAAVKLREPVLVFPVLDFVDYTPLPGLCRHATGDPSLPSLGMIACLQAAGGSKPTLWDTQQRCYTAPSKNIKKASSSGAVAALRDCLIMKPGSTAEDVFVVLKRLGALSGEFVRAEAAGAIGVPSRPIAKHLVMSKNDRIIKIMTSKRSAWQQNYK